jgi:nitrogenase subunit NifH
VSELIGIVEEIYANFGRGNVEAIVETFAEDIHFVHAGGPATGVGARGRKDR